MPQTRADRFPCNQLRLTRLIRIEQKIDSLNKDMRVVLRVLGRLDKENVKPRKDPEKPFKEGDNSVKNG